MRFSETEAALVAASCRYAEERAAREGRDFEVRARRHPNGVLTCDVVPARTAHDPATRTIFAALAPTIPARDRGPTGRSWHHPKP